MWCLAPINERGGPGTVRLRKCLMMLDVLQPGKEAGFIWFAHSVQWNQYKRFQSRRRASTTVEDWREDRSPALNGITFITADFTARSTNTKGTLRLNGNDPAQIEKLKSHFFWCVLGGPLRSHWQEKGGFTQPESVKCLKNRGCHPSFLLGYRDSRSYPVVNFIAKEVQRAS